MRRTWWTLIAIVSLLAAMAGPAVAAPGGRSTGGNDYVIVTLPSPPAAAYAGGIAGLAPTRPAHGRLDTSSPAYRAYLRHLDAEHAAFRTSLARVAPQARIVREYDVVLNGFAVELNGATPAEVARAQGVRAVGRSWLYRPTMNVSPYLIHADALWATTQGGQADAGAGIKVGIIDTGIDAGHLFFDCKTGDIPHKVYASGVALGAVNPTPTIVFDHGTHVAGIVAGCVTPGSEAQPVQVDGNLSGVAPGASLYDYNVFPGFGAGYWAFGGEAFSHDIAAALEDAVIDGMDVVNLSLGATVQGPHDFLADAVDAAVEAGTVVVVAAGNSGDGDATVESPGSAPLAITVGATSNAHRPGVPVAVGGNTYVATPGEFGPYGTATSGELVDWATQGDSTACTAVSGTPLDGDIALIDRGTCSFSTKIRNAQSAGAVGVVVVNNAAGPAIPMAQDGTADQPTIPGVMLSQDDGAAARGADLGKEATIGGGIEEFTATPNVLADFSGRGPTPYTSLVKPDVVAPGVNVYSSVWDWQDPTTQDSFAFFDGTSMATPHVTGSVALLLAAHPGWTPAEVKSALTNTADVTDVTGLPADRAPALQIGAGLVDLAAATASPLAADPVSVSFGTWTGNKGVARTVDVAFTGLASAGSCSVSVDGNAGLEPALSAGTVAAGDVLGVTLAAGKANTTTSGDYWGTITVDCGSDGTIHLPWWVRVDRRAKP